MESCTCRISNSFRVSSICVTVNCSNALHLFFARMKNVVFYFITDVFSNLTFINVEWSYWVGEPFIFPRQCNFSFIFCDSIIRASGIPFFLWCSLPKNISVTFNVFSSMGANLKSNHSFGDSPCIKSLISILQILLKRSKQLWTSYSHS